MGVSRGLLTVVLLLAAALAGSCNDKGREQDGSATVPASPGSSVSGDAASQPCAPVEQEADAAPAGDAGTEAADDNNSSSLERHWQEGRVELREPLTISLELRSAEFNPAENADLARLSFEASCQLGRHDWIYEDILLDDLQDTEAAVLELDVATIELQPLLQNPVVAGHTSTGQAQLRMDGGMHFTVLDPDHELMGSFLVNHDGEIYQADNGENYSWRISQTADDFTPVQYLFYRTPKSGEPVHYLFSVAYRQGAMARQQVKDPLGNEITYIFPNGSVEISPPPDPAKKKRDPNAEQRR